MEFKLKPQTICSFNSWEPKIYGVVLVKKEEHIAPVWEALCEQDHYWESYKDLIKIAPESIESEKNLQYLCEYVGKTDIYDVDDFQVKMKEVGIDVFLYQFREDSEFY